MTDIIETYRSRIATMDYTPLTDAQLVRFRAADRSAVANSAIEGLQRTELDDRFMQLLMEMRVPLDLSVELVKSYTADLLDPASLAA